MSITFGQLVDEVLINLNGYTFEQDRTTYLTQAVTAITSPSSSPTILRLASTESIGKGIVEIGEELIDIKAAARDPGRGARPRRRGRPSRATSW